MKRSGNTILVTGGGSGIGRALAEQFSIRGNRVIIAGRRREALDEVVYSHSGIEGAVLDINNGEAIGKFVNDVLVRRPTLNVVVHCAGIMRYERVTRAGFSTDIAEATISTNLLGTIRLTTALLPHFLSRPDATIVTISSGLAFVPLAMTPTYCATKAAVHSYSQSLRYQLKETNVRVVEIALPYVQTELMGAQQASDQIAMPLKDYINETMAILDANPDVTEVLVERVKSQRFAEARGDYDAFFNAYNSRAMAARADEW
ncbi:SDR family oxidoreductase [Bradyrhizobium sp. USDA 4469]